MAAIWNVPIGQGRFNPNRPRANKFYAGYIRIQQKDCSYLIHHIHAKMLTRISDVPSGGRHHREHWTRDLVPNSQGIAGMWGAVVITRTTTHGVRSSQSSPDPQAGVLHYADALTRVKGRAD
jgi:hypothetical protein